MPYYSRSGKNSWKMDFPGLETICDSCYTIAKKSERVIARITDREINFGGSRYAGEL